MSKQILAVLAAFCFIGIVAFLFLRNPAGQEFEDDKNASADEITRVDDSADKNLAMFRQAIDSEARPFNAPVTLHLAELCHAVYSNPETTTPKLFFDLRFDSVKPIGDGINKAYVATKGDVGIVVFRGTDEVRDWLTNFDIRNVPVQHGEVHSGFWNAYQELRTEIVDEFDRIKPKHIWITGHSLGGAMALCCAYNLEETTSHLVQGLVTFGQPKLSDGRFAGYIDSKFLGRYFAFSNNNDPVVDMVPLCSSCGSAVWFDNFDIKRSPEKRVSTSATFGSSGPDDDEFSREIMSMEEFQNLRERILNEDRPLQNPDGPIIVGSRLPIVRDHDMTAYLNKLRRHFSKPEMN